MIGMLLNVVHLQVHQKNRARESDGFHNYSTLLLESNLEVVRTDRTMNSEYINLKLVYAFL